MKKVLVVGDSMIDRYYFGSVSRVCPEAPLPILDVSEVDERLGGAANVALNLASLGDSVTLLTVGTGKIDLMGSNRIKVLRGYAAYDTEKHRLFSGSHMMARFDRNTCTTHDTEKSVLREFSQVYDQFDLIVFCDYGRGVLANVGEMLTLTRSHDIRTIVDPKGRDWWNYHGAWMIKPNHLEYGLAYNIPKCEHMIVTHQGEKVCYWENDASTAFEVPRVPVVDPTGCGDSFLAALAHKLLQGHTVYEAVLAGIKGGSAAVQHVGTYVLTKEDLL